MSIATESRQTERFNALAAAYVLTMTGDSGVLWDILQPITLLRVGVLVTTTVVAKTTLPHVRFDLRVIPDTDGGGRTQGLDAAADAMVIVPDGTFAGKIVYKDVRVDINPGQQIIPTVTTAATGAGAAGAGRFYYEYINRAEIPPNVGMIASA